MKNSCLSFKTDTFYSKGLVNTQIYKIEIKTQSSVDSQVRH